MELIELLTCRHPYISKIFEKGTNCLDGACIEKLWYNVLCSKKCSISCTVESCGNLDQPHYNESALMIWALMSSHPVATSSFDSLLLSEASVISLSMRLNDNAPLKLDSSPLHFQDLREAHNLGPERLPKHLLSAYCQTTLMMKHAVLLASVFQ